MRNSAVGPGRSRRTSPTAEFSTRSSNRKTRLRFLRRGGGPGHVRPPPLAKNTEQKIMTIADSTTNYAPPAPRKQRRSIAELLAPLEQIATHSPNLVTNHDARFEV